MASTLLDVLSSIPPESGVKARAVRRVIETTPYPNFLMFESRPDLFSRFFIEGVLPSVDFREYNTEATEQTGVTDEAYMQQLRPMSANIRIDVSLADVNTREGQLYKMKEVDRAMRSFALTMKKRSIGFGNGALHPLGLYGWNSYYNTAANPTVVDFAAAGAAITAGTAGALVQAVQALIDIVRPHGQPTFLLSNINILRQVDFLATNANNVSLSTRFGYRNVNVGGITQRVAFFDDFPWIPSDQDAQGVDIQTFTEARPDNSGSDCSSILAVKVGTDDYCMVQKSDSGPMVIESVQATKAVTNIEWPWGDESRHPRAIGRLRGIKAS